MYYAQFRGKLSNSKKELILATLFHLHLADILHGQATDMDMKAFEDFWKIFAIGNFKKS